MKSYQNAQQKFKLDIKKKMKRQVQIVKPDATPEEIDEVIMSGGGSGEVFKNVILKVSEASCRPLYGRSVGRSVGWLVCVCVDSLSHRAPPPTRCATRLATCRTNTKTCCVWRPPWPSCMRCLWTSLSWQSNRESSSTRLNSRCHRWDGPVKWCVVCVVLYGLDALCIDRYYMGGAGLQMYPGSLPACDGPGCAVCRSNLLLTLSTRAIRTWCRRWTTPSLFASDSCVCVSSFWWLSEWSLGSCMRSRGQGSREGSGEGGVSFKAMGSNELLALALSRCYPTPRHEEIRDLLWYICCWNPEDIVWLDGTYMAGKKRVMHVYLQPHLLTQCPSSVHISIPFLIVSAGGVGYVILLLQVHNNISCR